MRTVRRAFAIVILSTGSAFAQSTWTGAVDTNWSNASNWSPAVIPSATISAIIAPAAKQPIVTNVNPTTLNLTIQPGATMTLGAGFDLTVLGNVRIIANAVPATGALIVTSNASLIAVSGNWHQDDPSAYVPFGNTVTFAGTTPATISGGTGILFSNVALSGASKTVTIQAARIDVANEWTGNGGTANGVGVVRFTGNGTTSTGATGSIGNVECSTGSRTLAAGSFGSLTLSGATTSLSGTVAVSGAAALSTGSLTINAPSMLDVGGALTYAATTVSGSGVIRCHGNYASTSTLSNFWVEFVNGSSISGTPTIGLVKFVSGTTMLNAELKVTHDCRSTGGTTAGSAINLVGYGTNGSCVLRTDAHVLHEVKVGVGGRASVQQSRVKVLDLIDGSLLVAAGHTFTVEQEARLTAGTIGSEAFGGGVLDVLGDVVHAATAGNSHALTVKARGDWASTGTFSTHWVEFFDQSTISGAPTIDYVKFVSGTTTLNAELKVTHDCRSTGGTTAGSPINLIGYATNGYTELSNGNVELHEIKLEQDGRANVSSSSRVAKFRFSGGNLQLNASILTVTDFTYSGGAAAAVFGGYIECLGDFSGSAYLQNILVAFHDQSTISGTPTIGLVKFVSGTTMLNAELKVTHDCRSTGGTTAGSAINLVGYGTNGSCVLRTDAHVLHEVKVGVGGRASVQQSRVKVLDLIDGSLLVAAGHTFTVEQEARLTAGTIGSEAFGGGVLDVLGDVVHAATAGNLYALTVKARGDWASTGTFSTHWVEFFDQSTISGTPTIDYVKFVSGTTTLNAELKVTHDCRSTGGTTADSPINLVGYGTNGSCVLRTDDYVLHEVKVKAGGRASVQQSRVKVLDLIDGSLLLAAGHTLTVEQEARLTAGTIGSEAFGGGVLDVLGDVVHAATSGNLYALTVKARGDWASTGTFSSHWVEFFDQSTISGAPTIDYVKFVSGTTMLNAELKVTHDCRSTGGTTAGSAINLVGYGTNGSCVLRTDAHVLHEVKVGVGGRASVQQSRVKVLDLIDGSLLVAAGHTFTVEQEARLTAGTIGSEAFGGGVLDVLGDVVHAATAGNLYALTVKARGDWASTGTFSTHWVEFFDQSTISGTPTIDYVKFVSGTTTLNAELKVTHDCRSTGGTTADSPINLVGYGTNGSCVLRTDDYVLHEVKVKAGGRASVQQSRVKVLDLIDGSLLLAAGHTLTVEQEARLTAGTIGSEAFGGGVLDVLGDVVHAATSGNLYALTVKARGDWASTGTFSSHWVEFFDQSTISGTPTIDHVRFVSGVSTVNGLFAIGQNLQILASAHPILATGDLTFTGSSATLAGTLAVNAGRALRLGNTTNVIISSTGRLELLGTPGNRAVVTSSSTGGYGLTINGTLAARNFQFDRMNSAGIILGTTAQIAPVPNDVRDGIFDRAASSGGSALFDVRIPFSHVFANIAFDKSAGTGTYNVRRTSGPEVTFLNWGGILGGPQFEFDPTQVLPADPDGAVLWAGSNFPDLIVAATDSPALAVAQKPLPVTWTVQNQGGVEAVAPFVDRILLTKDFIVGNGDDITLGEFTRASDLIEGDIYEKGAAPQVPAGTQGIYRFAVVTDVNDAVAETGGESNNSLISPTTIQITLTEQPDLVAQSTTAPATAVDGEPMLVEWTVTNLGNAAAAGSWVDRLYLSPDATYGNDVFLGSFLTSGPIAVATAYQRSQNVTIPAGLHGPYYVIVRSDALNTVTPELNEANNTVVSNAPVDVQQLALPDLQPGAIAVSPAAFGQLYVGTQATLSATVTNLDANADAKGTANGTWTDRIVLSSDAILDANDTTLSTGGFSGVLSPLGTYSKAVSFTLPQVAGPWFVIVQVDASVTLPEGLETNNVVAFPIDVVGPEYGAMVTTIVDEAPSPITPGATLIPLTGIAMTLAPPSQPATNVSVLVKIWNGSAAQAVTVTTDASGQFNYLYEPLVNTAGTIKLYASHPAVVESPGVVAPDDSFVLTGLVASPAVATANVTVGQSTNGSFTLHNPGDVAVTGLTSSIQGVPAHLSLFGLNLPTSIVPFGSVSIPFTLNALNDPPPSGNTSEMFVSVGGQVAGQSVTLTTFKLYGVVSTAVPDLVALPGTLNVAAPKNEETIVAFTLRNVGGAAAHAVSVDVPCEANTGYYCPQAPLATLMTPNPIGDLLPGEERTIEISITPSSIAVNSQVAIPVHVYSQAESFDVPLHFTVTSNATGSLTVMARDEAYYWDSSGTYHSTGTGIGLAGATVSLTNPMDPAPEVSGTTDSFGQLIAPTVTEGTYLLQVSAPNHGTYSSIVSISPGQATVVTAFLATQAVSYDFQVEPTAVQDEYQITIEATFTTQVPVPKLVIEPSLIELDLAPGQSKQVDLVIRNDGLISAFGVELFLDDLPNFAVDPAITSIPEVAGGQAYVVPVVITRLTNGASPCDSSTKWGVRYYVLNGEPVWYWTPIFYLTPTQNCSVQVVGGEAPPDLPPPVLPPDIPTPSGSGSGGGGGGGGGGAGGSGSWSGGSPSQPVVTPPPVITLPAGCSSSG